MANGRDNVGQPKPDCTVALMMMPFGPTDRPSLGLSLLAQCLKDAGYSARVLYPNLDFEQRVGTRLYEEISFESNAILAGEWLFSRVLDPIGNTADYIGSAARRYFGGTVPKSSSLAKLMTVLPGALRDASALVDRWADAVGA